MPQKRLFLTVFVTSYVEFYRFSRFPYICSSTNNITNEIMPQSLRAVLIITLISVATSCGNKESSTKKAGDTLEGTISMSGAFALYPLANKWAEEFQKLHPDVRFNISAGGAGKGGIGQAGRRDCRSSSSCSLFMRVSSAGCVGIRG